MKRSADGSNYAMLSGHVQGTTMLRTTLMSTLLTIGLPPAALAQSISSEFDGEYTARTYLASYWRNADDCLEGAEFPVTLSEGRFGSAADGIASGFVTSAGYFQAEFAISKTEIQYFEGNLEGDKLIGSALAKTCAWEV